MRYPALLYLWSCLLFSQEKTPPILANLPVQAVGAGDLLVLSSTEAPELARSLRVRADGTIPIPGIVEPLRVQGLLPMQIERRIDQALQQAKLYIEPAVTVSVGEYQSRPVSVIGAVKRPLVFQAIGSLTLLEALARAEGLSTDAGGEIIVTRRNPDSTRHIPVKALLAGIDREWNVTLTGGEEVRIPEAGKVVVWGNVKKSGVYPVQESGQSSVMTLLAQAEGLQSFSAKIAYVYRVDGTGGHTEIPVELARLMARKAPDVSLQPQDILYIPDNTGRRMTAAALDRIAGFGTSTASGLIIWKH